MFRPGLSVTQDGRCGSVADNFLYSDAKGKKVKIRGIPHLAKNERDARISCTQSSATASCAAFIEESRIKPTNATKLRRKSGGVGHPRSLAGTELPCGGG